MAIITAIEDVRKVLNTAKIIAVLGAHPTTSKAAHYVPRYMQAEAYEIYPVNPNYEGQQLFGKTVIASLRDLTVDPDVVNVFRRSEAVADHLHDILAMSPLPKVVWLQLGIRHDETAEALSAAGIDVIQDRCMLADHQYLL